MHTYHIHIKGIVQGVGFRPYVCRVAEQFHINGFVSNACDGVHIECNALPETVKAFYQQVISDPPANAVITAHHLEEIPVKIFCSFAIRQSIHDTKPDLLLTPDIALCDNCRHELLTAGNKRFQYAFTTCLNCGPRYSITTALPYDREHTTMSNLVMCPSCTAEYNNIQNRRHYSQTNSCKECAVPMHWYSSSKICLSNNADQIQELVIEELKKGRIIAVKGIGGYLLLCDAANETTVHSLRTRKQRPAKPFALLYPNIEMADGDVCLHSFEINALHDKSAPIVLCRMKAVSANGICKEMIAPGLDKIGLMLPCSPLLLLIATAFGKPLIATSGNISGASIIYKDKDALLNLFEVADFVLTYERDIVAPQDDSVIRFTDSGQKIVLRRSRGLAPDYFPNPFAVGEGTLLAMGSELKSAFAIAEQNNLYISQYLGDQGSLEAQLSYKKTLQHFTSLIQAVPQHILIDKHPGYFVSQSGKEMADTKNIPLTAIQHHKAHFGAVLAENNLLQTNVPVAGFIWDGTGYGDDGQIWGGEIFMYEDGEMERVAQLDYFPQLLGDKMSKEPRLSALSLLKNLPHKQAVIEKYFSVQEWKYYQQLVQQHDALLTSSMGRFLDGIASILGICQLNTYEGEAAMKLEVLAASCMEKVSDDYYPVLLQKSRLDWSSFLTALINDQEQGKDIAAIAWKVFFSLYKMIEQVISYFKIENVAFGGGVFQNALLVHLLTENISPAIKLYFHRQLSPNDECIGFGQIACFEIENTNEKSKLKIPGKNKTAAKQFQLTD
ncbi:carbamoyltransferase HypF [Ferruginibacter profundus]